MQLRFTSLAGTLCAILVVSASATAADLVDFWRFDNNVNNSGTSGRVGTLEDNAGFTTTQVAPGAGSSHSLQVDGDTDAYIISGATDRTNLSNTLEGNFALSFWARSAVTAADVGSGSIGYMFDFGEGHGSGIGIGFIDNHGTFGGNTDNIGAYYTNDGMDSGVSGLADQWYHVAMTRDGNTVSLYVDGQLEDTTIEAGPNIATNRPFSIGREAKNTSEREWQGFLDEFGIFSESLSAEEISLINDIAVNTTLDYDLAEVNQLFELHELMDSMAVVELGEDTWQFFTDDGTFATLGIAPGEAGFNAAGRAFLNFGGGTGLATAVPEPASLALWSLLALIGFAGYRLRNRAKAC